MRPISRLLIGALLLSATAVTADVTTGGQVRSRWELRDSDGVQSDGLTATRTRASVHARLEGGVSASMQWQDVRVWGEEGNTLGDYSGDQIDLHQGWVQFADFADMGVDLRLGRQEIAFGGQRLVGTVGWTHQGRSFDAPHQVPAKQGRGKPWPTRVSGYSSRAAKVRERTSTSSW
tara:strand:- start:1085 stop:1612 length:528 start_codon:yes stop_codon:yes gene_type:complete